MTPPPGPFRPTFWRSPIRGPWLTSALGTILGVLLVVVAVTGFLSHAAYQPDLPGNAIVPPGADLPLTFSWPAGPAWLYALTQGLHVNLGLAAAPFLLAKLWSVIPRLFVLPPVTSPAQAIERASIALLVAGSVFELATGIANAQYWYPFHFNFVVAHYYGAVVFSAAFVVHLVVKIPVAARAYRDRGWLKPLRDDVLHTRPEPVAGPDPGLVPVAPAAATMSRRGLLAFAGGGALLLLGANAGQSLGGPFRRLAFLAPRREPTGAGNAEFPVNRTARVAGITPELVGAGYALELRGTREVRLSHAQLRALPQRTARIPLGCVEGWSTEQEWTGVPLLALARMAGVPRPAQAHVESLQPRGALREATLNGAQVRAGDALLALQVNGADLTLDHGYPARIIAPAVPGVHNTKWVGVITFS